MFYSVCLLITTTMGNCGLTEKNDSRLNSKQVWAPQFKDKPSLISSLKVQSHDIINYWPGCIFNGFDHLMVGFEWMRNLCAYLIELITFHLCTCNDEQWALSMIISCMCPANEKRCHIVTSCRLSLTGCMHRCTEWTLHYHSIYSWRWMRIGWCVSQTNHFVIITWHLTSLSVLKSSILR